MLLCLIQSWPSAGDVVSESSSRGHPLRDTAECHLFLMILLHPRIDQVGILLTSSSHLARFHSAVLNRCSSMARGSTSAPSDFGSFELSLTGLPLLCYHHCLSLYRFLLLSLLTGLTRYFRWVIWSTLHPVICLEALPLPLALLLLLSTALPSLGGNL